MSDETEQKDEEELTDLQKEERAAEKELEELEGEPPSDLQDWPDGDAKYKTFGGPDSQTGYSEGATANLGESDVRYHEDGSVTVAGEKVDNPDDYKGEPIPGGPTDPDAQRLAGDKTQPKGEDEGDQDEARGSDQDEGEGERSGGEPDAD